MAPVIGVWSRHIVPLSTHTVRLHVKLVLECNMHLFSLITVVVYLTYSILIPYMVFADLRYTFRKRRSKNWPTTTAKIDNGDVGFRGPLSRLPSILHRVHFTYSYSVNGLQHSGRFYLLVGDLKIGEELRQKLAGRSVPIKYDERKPQVALLMDEALAGQRVMQGPSWTYR